MTCVLCAVDFGDDAHWHDDLETWVCETCCPSCDFSPLGGGEAGAVPSRDAAPAQPHRTEPSLVGARGAGAGQGGERMPRPSSQTEEAPAVVCIDAGA
jgi:hypothetical protein